MATIRRLLLGFCTIIFGSNVVKPVFSQTFTNISIDTSSCTTARMTSEVNPISRTYFFTWFVTARSSGVVINLVTIALDNNGNVKGFPNPNNYSGRYNATNDPSILNPPNAPFNATLNFNDLGSDEEFVFILDVSGLNVRSEPVSRPSCRFPNDSNCMSNCLNEILCDNSITKQCADGKSVVQECPVDVSTAKYNPCGDEVNAAGSSTFIIAGIVTAIVVVIVICSIYAFRIYSARIHTVDHTQKLARNEAVPEDNYDQ